MSLSCVAVYFHPGKLTACQYLFKMFFFFHSYYKICVTLYQLKLWTSQALHFIPLHYNESLDHLYTLVYAELLMTFTYPYVGQKRSCLGSQLTKEIKLLIYVFACYVVFLCCSISWIAASKDVHIEPGSAFTSQILGDIWLLPVQDGILINASVAQALCKLIFFWSVEKN